MSQPNATRQAPVFRAPTPHTKTAAETCLKPKCLTEVQHLNQVKYQWCPA